MTTVNTSALRKAFEIGREAWWVTRLRLEPEDEHENDEACRLRVEANERCKAAYDRQTLLIVCGDTTIPVAPLSQETVLRAANGGER